MEKGDLLMKTLLKDYFDVLTKNLVDTLNNPDAYLNRIALTAVTIVAAVLLYMLLNYIIIKNIKDFKISIRLNRVFKQAIVTLSIMAVLFIWIQAINALILIALIMLAFIIIMLRGLIHNIIGYFVIKYNKYFQIGYRVEIDNIIGDVIDINPISFKLLEVGNWLSSNSKTGRVIQVPNSIIFEESIEMVSLENIFVWHEIKYTLSFDSNWEDAEKIMTNIGHLHFKESILPNLKEKTRYLPNEKSNLQPVFALDTNDNGIVVNLRYLVNYQNGSSTKTYLQRKILKSFEENPHIKIAVNDVRIIEK